MNKVGKSTAPSAERWYWRQNRPTKDTGGEAQETIRSTTNSKRRSAMNFQAMLITSQIALRTSQSPLNLTHILRSTTFLQHALRTHCTYSTAEPTAERHAVSCHCSQRNTWYRWWERTVQEYKCAAFKASSGAQKPSNLSPGLLLCMNPMPACHSARPLTKDHMRHTRSPRSMVVFERMTAIERDFIVRLMERRCGRQPIKVAVQVAAQTLERRLISSRSP